jgi:hypothetical protein
MTRPSKGEGEWTKSQLSSHRPNVFLFYFLGLILQKSIQQAETNGGATGERNKQVRLRVNCDKLMNKGGLKHKLGVCVCVCLCVTG